MALEKNPLGRKAKCYWNKTDVQLVAGTSAAAATWIADGGTTVAGELYDVSQATPAEYADISTRARTAAGFSARKPVLRDGEVTFDILWHTNDNTDEFAQTLIDKTNDSGEITLAFLDYAVDDADGAVGEEVQGMVARWYVNFEKSEAIRDVQKASITLVHSNYMIWYKYSIPS